MGSDALHRSFVVVDVEGYGDLTRTTHQRLAAREGMYHVLMSAFADCDLPWDDKAVDDAGDSLIVVLPGDVPKSRLADHLPARVAAKLREHNAVHAHGARLRMRMALHAGEVAYDGRGKTSAELIFVCRILDAREAKRALRESLATLVLIASDPFYDSVIRHEPATRPEAYRLVDVQVKETQAKAWIRLVDDDRLPVVSAPDQALNQAPSRALDQAPSRTLSQTPTEVPYRASAWPTMPLAALGAFVDVLLRTPGFDTREGRDLVLQELPFASSLRRHAADRADTISVVRGCEHYPDGLEALVEALRLHAAGSTAMDELDTLMAARRAGR